MPLCVRARARLRAWLAGWQRRAAAAAPASSGLGCACWLAAGTAVLPHAPCCPRTHARALLSRRCKTQHCARDASTRSRHAHARAWCRAVDTPPALCANPLISHDQMEAYLTRFNADTVGSAVGVAGPSGRGSAEEERGRGGEEGEASTAPRLHFAMRCAGAAGLRSGAALPAGARSGRTHARPGRAPGPVRCHACGAVPAAGS